MGKNTKGNRNGIERVKGKSVGRGQFKVNKDIPAKSFTTKQKVMINQTIRAVLSSNGNKTEASDVLGISIQALYKRFKSYPVILKKINDFNENTIKLAEQQLKSNASNSVQEVISIAEQSKSDNTRLQANLEILDRVGLGKKQESNTNVQVNVLNAIKEDIKEYDI